MKRRKGKVREQLEELRRWRVGREVEHMNGKGGMVNELKGKKREVKEEDEEKKKGWKTVKKGRRLREKER